jgi:hypothetical protein
VTILWPVIWVACSDQQFMKQSNVLCEQGFFFCFSIFAVSKVWQFFPLATFSGFTLKLQKFPITFKKIHGHIAKMHPKRKQ